MPSGARDMALAVEIHLPRNALTPDQSSLSHWIERAVAGDTSAFEQIMIHSQQRVMAMTWRILGNEADARDASQEIFLRVYKYLGRFEQGQDFFAWLYQITVNVCRDISKKRQRHSDRFTLLDACDAKEFSAVPDEQDGVEEIFLHAEQRELISRAMATLPAKERASIVLRDVEGLTTEEVAQIMKSSSTTVRSQISSGRKKIKSYCEQYLRRKGALTAS
jgi:RNA polymerase sigma-70 factor (ECF subfamily)